MSKLYKDFNELQLQQGAIYSNVEDVTKVPIYDASIKHIKAEGGRTYWKCKVSYKAFGFVPRSIKYFAITWFDPHAKEIGDEKILLVTAKTISNVESMYELASYKLKQASDQNEDATIGFKN